MKQYNQLATLKNFLRLFLTFSLFFFFQQTKAQRTGPQKFIRCGTSEYYQKLFRANPALKQKFEDNQRRLARKKITNGVARIMDVADTIALVVHVVASSALQAQITDAIIQSQIDVLNEDYQGLNADTSRIPAHFKPLFARGKIVFKLAGTSLFDEPTNGIVRVVKDTTYNQSNFDDAKSVNKGGSEAWNPSKYLNIWVVDFGSSNVLGISVFPGDTRDIKLHGFICDYRAFGRGAPYLFSQFNKGRTTTHELGHFFNLRHIWGDDDGDCTGTDFPDDTANDDTPNQGDNTEGNPDPLGIGVVKTDACSPNPPGIMYQNYMDYTDDSVLVMFTKGQLSRMEKALSESEDRFPLLSSTTYQDAPVYTNDIRIRNVIYPSAPLCSTSFTPIITLRNSGSATLISAQIVSVLNNNTPVIFNWTGSLAPYTEINLNLPGLTGVLGSNNLTIYTSKPNNVNDERNSNDTIKIQFEVFGITVLNNRVDEGFSSPQFPPQQWRVNNPDKDTTWSRNATIGKNAPGSAWFNDWNNPTFGSIDDLITPNFSYTNVDSVYLYFNLAAATYSYPGTTENDIDTLEVLVTRDCGNSFSTVYKKWGEDLQTTGDPNFPTTNEFFPNSTQWRRDSINLSTVLGQSEAQFQIYFRIRGNFENNVFIDDVSIVPEVLPQRLKEEGYLIYPTAFRDQFFIWHYQMPTDLKFIQVYNAAGQLVWSTSYDGNANRLIAVNLRSAAAGIYFVKIGYGNSGRNITQRIVKQ